MESEKKRIITIFENWIIFGILTTIYLALAWKNPFKTNNLISNLEPYPDTLYYSVPAWNWVHGKGFKMEAFGIEIKQIVPPLYGLYLAPLFKIFNDVRSYYFGNVALGILSIYLFLKLIEVLWGKNRNLVKFILGLVLVTNFYFYNLPTLLMAENILIPLTLGAVILALSEINKANLIKAVAVTVLLLLTKISALPVIACLWLSVFLKTEAKVQLMVLKITAVLGIGGVIFLWPSLMRYFRGIGDFNPLNMKDTLPLYLSEFLGINGRYLWFNNPQIEPLIGWLALVGLVWGLVKREYRKQFLIVLAFILSVVVFHSQMKYPEGRYLSTVIPLYLLFVGIFIKNKLGFGVAVVMLGLFLGTRININGFYERKITTLKRQVLNNRLEENEVPWNYKAIQRMNEYFDKPDQNTYLVTLLTPFYVQYFGNGNYQYLPFSHHQEFSGPEKEYVESVYKQDGSLIHLYKKLISEGKRLYMTNYYMVNYHGSMDDDFKEIESNFRLKEEADGCMGLCKVYLMNMAK